jgi:hypothetical protein
MIAGTLGIEPRLERVPVRLPYPGPLKTGSIYESQSLVHNKFFGTQKAS